MENFDGWNGSSIRQPQQRWLFRHKDEGVMADRFELIGESASMAAQSCDILMKSAACTMRWIT